MQSGIRVGEVYEEPEVTVEETVLEEEDYENNYEDTSSNTTTAAPDYEDVTEKPKEVENALPVLYEPMVANNKSHFSICLRFKIHYHRPEMVLMGAYANDLTVVVIGMSTLLSLKSNKHSC